MVKVQNYTLHATRYTLRRHIISSSHHLIISSLLLFSFFLFSFLPVSAQSKFGHVDYGEVMKNMHGIDSIQTVITDYRAELQAIGEQMVKEFQEKQTALEQLTNAPNSSPAIVKIKNDELVDMYRRIQEFEQSMYVDLQDKQVELLEPFQTQLLEVIKKVAKNNNYTYIFDISTLLFHAPTDDLTDKVKAELGIK